MTTRVRNISKGPRGAFVKAKGDSAALTEVWANPGEDIDADDYDEAHFAPVDSDEAHAAALVSGGLSLSKLVAQGVDAGLFESEAAFRADLQRAIDAALAAGSGVAPGGSVDDEDTEPTDEEILAAVGELDPKNDDHWTSKGEPGVDAVNEILEAKVTRADIKRAAPDAARPE